MLPPSLSSTSSRTQPYFSIRSFCYFRFSYPCADILSPFSRQSGSSTLFTRCVQRTAEWGRGRNGNNDLSEKRVADPRCAPPAARRGVKIPRLFFGREARAILCLLLTLFCPFVCVSRKQGMKKKRTAPPSRVCTSDVLARHFSSSSSPSLQRYDEPASSTDVLISVEKISFLLAKKKNFIPRLLANSIIRLLGREEKRKLCDWSNLALLIKRFLRTISSFVEYRFVKLL